MSFALPARQVTFGRSNVPPQQQQQYQSQYQPPQHSLSLPSTTNPYLANSSVIGLPGPSPLSQSHSPPDSAPSPKLNAIAGPSTPPSSAAAPAVPLTLEQQHITAVEGIVPTLQNIVATVNLDCRLDLKTIALHARNAEYNPKVCIFIFST